MSAISPTKTHYLYQNPTSHQMLKNWNSTAKTKLTIILVLSIINLSDPLGPAPATDWIFTPLFSLFWGIVLVFFSRYSARKFYSSTETWAHWNSWEWSRKDVLTQFQFWGWLMLGVGTCTQIGSLFWHQVISLFGLFEFFLGAGMLIGVYLASSKK
ncbi:hypothetical protein KFE98_07430 [bacterium SCSIO 12741]|nr:hypothetical protein KFE98_07430 [bacterium SCSIO 12741]